MRSGFRLFDAWRTSGSPLKINGNMSALERGPPSPMLLGAIHREPDVPDEQHANTQSNPGSPGPSRKSTEQTPASAVPPADDKSNPHPPQRSHGLHGETSTSTPTSSWHHGSHGLGLSHFLARGAPFRPRLGPKNCLAYRTATRVMDRGCTNWWISFEQVSRRKKNLDTVFKRRLAPFGLI